MKINKLSIIIPVFNEEKTIGILLDQLTKLKLDKIKKQIIVVNDGSTDNSLKIIKQKISKNKNRNCEFVLINKKKNKGKGVAMKLGAEAAWKNNSQKIIFLDGDGQHDPKHIPDFYKLLETNDIVIGIRKLKTKIPFYRRLGNEIFIFLMKFFFHINIEDVICGYRGFTKNGYNKIRWESRDYGVEVEMMTIIGRKKLKYKTTVVDTIYHEKYKGFSILDGFKILLKLPYWKFRRLS